jgi:hypothetical protein
MQRAAQAATRHRGRRTIRRVEWPRIPLALDEGLLWLGDALACPELASRLPMQLLALSGDVSDSVVVWSPPGRACRQGTLARVLS